MPDATDPPPGTERSARDSVGANEPANVEAPSGPDKDPAAVALGRKGGLKGGPARASKLTAERRSEIARQAAAARWHSGS